VFAFERNERSWCGKRNKPVFIEGEFILLTPELVQV